MDNNGLVFLITSPEHEDRVFYCSKWSFDIIEQAKNHGLRIANLEKDKANRKNFEGHMLKQNPAFVMFNGHGLSDLVMGHDDEVLLKKGENENLMRDKIVYARSCDALTVLGEACAGAGSQAFIGYSIPFAFVSDTNKGAHPLEDELAKPCMVTSNIVPISIIRGKTVLEAVEKAKVEMRKLLEQWETRQDRIEAPFVAMCLYWNSLALGYAGNENAKL